MAAPVPIALIVIRGYSYAMSLARAKKLVETGGTIVSVINKAKGTKPSLKLFRKNNGSPTQAAMKGSNHPAITNSNAATSFFAKAATGRGLTNTQLDILRLYARGAYNNPAARKALLASGMTAVAAGLILKDIDSNAEKLDQYPIEPGFVPESIYQQTRQGIPGQQFQTREEWEQSLRDRKRYVPSEDVKTPSPSIFQQMRPGFPRQEYPSDPNRTRYRPDYLDDYPEEFITSRPSILQGMRESVPPQEVLRDTDRTRYRPTNLNDYPEEPITSKSSVLQNLRMAEAAYQSQEVPEEERRRYTRGTRPPAFVKGRPLSQEQYNLVRQYLPATVMSELGKDPSIGRVSTPTEVINALRSTVPEEDFRDITSDIVPSDSEGNPKPTNTVMIDPKDLVPPPPRPTPRPKRKPDSAIATGPAPKVQKATKSEYTKVAESGFGQKVFGLRRSKPEIDRDVTYTRLREQGRVEEANEFLNSWNKKHREKLEDALDGAKSLTEYTKGTTDRETSFAEDITDAAKRFSTEVKERVTKKGGGRVSSRPKKVMKKMYAKGGSVRKPKRIK